MNRSHVALLFAALLVVATSAPAYQISAQTKFGLGGPFEDSLTEPEVSASTFFVVQDTTNTIEMSSFVSGQSGVLEGRSRIDIVSGISTLPAQWVSLLRENLVLHPNPGETEIVVRASLDVVTNSSTVVYPNGPQGYAFQHVLLRIEYEDNAPGTNFAADGHMVQSLSGPTLTLWDGPLSVSPPEAGTASGSIETGSIDLELHIPVSVIGSGRFLKVQAQITGEADAGNHATSYAESGLDTQLSIDVGGGTYDSTFPFFLAPEPEGALLGVGAIAALAITATRRRR